MVSLFHRFGVLVLLFCIIQKCARGNVQVFPTTVELLLDEGLFLTFNASWSGETIVNIKIENVESDFSRVPIACKINSSSQTCMYCSRGHGIFWIDCSNEFRTEKSNEIIFNVNSHSFESGNGRILVEFTDNNNRVINKYVTVINNFPTRIEGVTGDNVSFVAKWGNKRRIMTAKIIVSDIWDNEVSTTCNFDFSTYVCVSCSQPEGSNIKADCPSTNVTKLIAFSIVKLTPLQKICRIEFSDDLGFPVMVSNRYIDLAVKPTKPAEVAVTPSSIHGSEGDNINVTLSWNEDTYLSHLSIKHTIMNYDINCKIDYRMNNTEECCSITEPRLIKSECKHRQIVWTFVSLGLKDNGRLLIKYGQPHQSLITRELAVKVDMTVERSSTVKIESDRIFMDIAIGGMACGAFGAVVSIVLLIVIIVLKVRNA